MRFGDDGVGRPGRRSSSPPGAAARCRDHWPPRAPPGARRGAQRTGSAHRLTRRARPVRRPFTRKASAGATRRRASARAVAIRAATAADGSGSRATHDGGRRRRAASSTHRSIRSRSGPEISRWYRSTTPIGHGQPSVGPGEPAWTRVHRGDQLEPRRERGRAAGTGDRHAPLLQRLPERFEDIAVELRKLVEEQHAMVRPRDLAGRQARPAADHRRRTRSCDAGVRNGGRATSSVIGPSPAADATIVTASAAASSSGGRSPGTSVASRSCPSPGGPIRSRPCPPASAISRARLAPRTGRGPRRDRGSGSHRPMRQAASARPGSHRVPGRRRARPVGEAAGDARERADRTSSTASVSVSTGRTSTPSTSRGFDRGRPARPTTRRTPRRASAATIGSTPGTGRTSPPSDSSPMHARPGHGPAGPAPSRAGCRPPSPDRARRRPCDSRPGRG